MVGGGVEWKSKQTPVCLTLKSLTKARCLFVGADLEHQRSRTTELLRLVGWVRSANSYTIITNRQTYSPDLCLVCTFS